MSIIVEAHGIEFILPHTRRAWGAVNGPHLRERSLWARPQEIAQLAHQVVDLRRRKPGQVRLIEGIDGYYVAKEADGRYTPQQVPPASYSLLWVYREDGLVYTSFLRSDEYRNRIIAAPAGDPDQVDMVER